ncbi:permease [Pseudomonas sp. ICMP 460]|uniref:permease n=1 Tax=Pseudomonas sp. ICMP 460 TaxID=1718917 RepID=UPI000C068CC9|nr:permease [Pseudomonas sp. ICMP 460]PHN26815.1 hypothetical protein AO240_00995 [Pseudomonas sp. ICMP 460]
MTEKVDEKYIPLEEKSLLGWELTTIAVPKREIIKSQTYLLLCATIACAYMTWIMWARLPSAIYELITLYFVGYGLVIYLSIFALRQKTHYHYRITSRSGEIKYRLHFSDSSRYFFKIIAVSVILLFIVVAFFTKSFLFLIGPVAIALGSAKILLNWKSEEKFLKGCPWEEYNFVTIDNERLMIIAHRKNQTVGFEARFSNIELLNRYLSIIEPLLSTSVIYTKKSWPY